MRMTQSQVDAHNARITARQHRNDDNVGAIPDPYAVANAYKAACREESKLHAEILAECKRRGWLVFHGSMAHRSRRTVGEPDFVILHGVQATCCACGGQVIGMGCSECNAPDVDYCPRVTFIEVKTRTGKLSAAQAAVHAHAEKLGHRIRIVRSFEQFLEVVR